MREKAIQLLTNLCDSHSISGFEHEVREIFLRELGELEGSIDCDRLGSICYTSSWKGPKVLLTGHMDEVGFRVQSITPDGFLKFVTIGGWWPHTLLSQRVHVRLRCGEKVLGVISSTPPHFLPESQRSSVLPIEAMFIDVGARSRLEVEEDLGIRIGDAIAPAVEFTKLGKQDRFLAKAFDNRVGMAAAIQTMQELENVCLRNQLIVAGTVQEEVGLRGAKTLAKQIRPDVAIVLEGPPADDIPGFGASEQQGKLGGGVQIRLHDPTAMMNPKLAELAIRVARSHSIPYQITVRKSGGTDAGALHLANEGVPCIVLGTPARYIHSHNSVIQLSDYLAMVELSKAIAHALDEETVAELTRFL